MIISSYCIKVFLITQDYYNLPVTTHILRKNMTNSSTLFFICADITIDTFHKNVLKFDVGQNRVILNLYDKLKLFFLAHFPDKFVVVIYFEQCISFSKKRLTRLKLVIIVFGYSLTRNAEIIAIFIASSNY